MARPALDATPAQLVRAAAGGPVYLCFLGLAATRVWLQCNMFGSYVQSDDGLVSVVSNMSYGLTMLVAAGLTCAHRPSERGERMIGWASFFVMTAATLALIAGKESGAFQTVLGASAIAGVGGAVGGGMWTVVYRRLALERAVFYGFASLGLGSLGGLMLGFLPNYASYVMSAFMPALALLCFEGALRAPEQKTCVKETTVYDDEPHSSAVCFLVGIAAFGFALGIVRGFPVGEAVPLSVLMRVVHQVGVAVLSVLVVWRVVVSRRQLSFRFLWGIEVATVVVGVVLLSLFPGSLTEVGVAVVNIADTLMLGVLWVALQDVCRHTSLHAYVVYGVVWAARVLFRNAGRVLVMLFGASVAGATSVAAAAAFSVAVSMVLLLSGGLLKRRPLFGFGAVSGASVPAGGDAVAGMGALAGAGAETGALAYGNASTLGGAGASASASASAPAHAGVSASAVSHAVESEPECDCEHDAWEVLQARYGLSDREMEVLVLLSQGRSKVYVADALFISENTVRAHAKKIYAKLGVHNKQELIDCVESALHTG